MKRPRLTRELVLETPVRLPDGAGGFQPGWSALGTLWAEVTPRPGREAEGAGIVRSRVSHRITVRAALPGMGARPLPEQRFREGTRIFSILAVWESDHDARYLTCETIEEQAA